MYKRRSEKFYNSQQMSCCKEKLKKIMMNGWNVFTLQVIKLSAVLNAFINDKHRKNILLNEGGKHTSAPGARVKVTTRKEGGTRREERSTESIYPTLATAWALVPRCLFSLRLSYSFWVVISRPLASRKWYVSSPGGRGIAKEKKDFHTCAPSVYCT